MQEGSEVLGGRKYVLRTDGVYSARPVDIGRVLPQSRPIVSRGLVRFRLAQTEILQELVILQDCSQRIEIRACTKPHDASTPTGDVWFMRDNDDRLSFTIEVLE